jgi:hypothetical protein
MTQPTLARHFGSGFARFLYYWCMLGLLSVPAMIIGFMFASDSQLGAVVEAIAIAIFSIVLYSLPSVLACGSVHPSRTGVYFVNWLLGWTILGWIVAMIWALAGFNARNQALAEAGPIASPPALAPTTLQPLRRRRPVSFLEAGLIGLAGGLTTILVIWMWPSYIAVQAKA